jgi:hypothetical protein
LSFAREILLLSSRLFYALSSRLALARTRSFQMGGHHHLLLQGALVEMLGILFLLHLLLRTALLNTAFKSTPSIKETIEGS